MAKKPKKKKAQNSFLLGILVTLLITGIIIAFLIVKILSLQKQEEGKIMVCVLTSSVKSGQTITMDMVKQLEVDRTTVPSNSFGDTVNTIDTYSLLDSRGNSLVTRNGQLSAVRYDAEGQLMTDDQGNPTYYPIETLDGVNYYYQGTNEKVELQTVPIIAKVDLEPNTVLTSGLVQRSDDAVTDDLRKVEYNMILLPTQLTTGQYVDIRLRLPNGSDFIVVSHKEVTLPMVAGVDSATTISMNLSELEILMLSGAILEAYQIEGSKLYAVEYVEPGLQESAVSTYVPSTDILNTINSDPNCIAIAKKGLLDRIYNSHEGADGNTVYDSMKDSESDKRQMLNNALQDNEDRAEDNISENLQKEIETMQEERQNYLESLGGTY